VLLLAGCTQDEEPKAAGPSVIAPGKPGEAAETLSAEDARQAVGDDTPNAADVSYVRDMVVHHEQALVMTGLAAQHARAKPVRGIAERIAAAQGPEVKTMKAWLRENDDKGSGGHDDHDHAAMPGMATAAQLRDLGAARGEEFDALFLKLMIAHHEGAVTMGTELLGKGNNEFVEKLATDVVGGQSSEIDRMRAMT
jgi:uncharacterized protein (DUF305 family)